jgi:hypothetical protein|tara:strand:+ start:2400 stop:3932 length:1533 start_codon:yes stop_codon:yes gene_type:complete
MDVDSKSDKKVSHQLSKLKLDDKAIEKVKSDNRANIPFAATGNLKGLHLRIGKSGTKTFYLIGKVKGSKKTFFHKCGEYQQGVTGVAEIQEYINELVKKHKHREGYWKSNPNAEKVEQEEILQQQRHTIRSAIQVICEHSFPRIKLDGSIDKKSIQTYSQYLFGWNKRREHLRFSEDNEGCGVVELIDDMKWNILWARYKPYENCTHPTDRSLYDSKLGGLEVDQLTPRIVQNWCNKGTTLGARQNRLKSFQYFYRACNKLNLLANEDKLDPTRVKYGGVSITSSKKKVSNNHRYNNMKFKSDQLERIQNAAKEIRDEHPFQTEAVLFILHSSRRQEETLKLTTDDLYKHNGKPHNRVITLPANITKSRTEEYAVITDGIQWVLDSLSYQRAKPEYRKYAHIKWLFPRSRIASEKCGDIDFCNSDNARTKNLESVWKKIKAKTGIDGQKKLFRKSLSTIATDTLGSTAKAITITGHKQTSTLEKHYYKTDIEDQIKYADDVAKVYAFKKK